MISGDFNQLRDDGGFSGGLAPAAISGKWGYIDTTGKWAIDPQFEQGERFSAGLAMVVVAGRTGFIDRKGAFVVNPQYDRAGHFVASYAAVWREGKVGFIDTTGAVVVDATFWQAKSFSDGLAPVQTDLGWGYVDPTGRMAITSEFDDADAFQNGLARVMVLSKEAYITTTGAFVVNPFPGATVKQEKERLAAEALQAERDAKATQQAAEARAVDERTRMIAQAPTLVLGTWRWSDSQVSTYKPDGTVLVLDNRGRETRQWTINGDTLLWNVIEFNGRPVIGAERPLRIIIELTQSKFTVRDPGNGQTYSATRVQ